MELVQPERDGLAIPAQGQVKRIVDRAILIVVLHVGAVDLDAIVLLLVRVDVFLHLHLFSGLTLLLLEVLHRLVDRVPEQIAPLGRSTLEPGNALVFAINHFEQFLLLLKRQALHFLHLLFVHLSGLVGLENGLASEELVGWKAEEGVVACGLLPARNAPIGPAILELLVELCFELSHAYHRLRSEQQTPQIRDDAVQVLRVLAFAVLAKSWDLVELIESLQKFDVV
mmetsp:Transcript_7786/g.11264  ORF Transcript_7786/g.11264 Transcript_7786/m.11264 type:complete len:227 (+) Transcript_7786:394-1074(+)